jgi:hypothetical protein
MNGSGQIAAIRAVQSAAKMLTLACTEIVGPTAMSLGMAEASTLGEPLPRKMVQATRKIDRKDRKR